MDANTYYTDRHHTEQASKEQRLESYVAEKFPHVDLEDLTEALACYATNELIDALRTGKKDRFYDLCCAAVVEMLELRCVENGE